MKRHDQHALFAMFAVLLLSALAGCNSTPTVPIPPPDMREVTTTSPDADGFVTVLGGQSAAEPESMVLLFNEDLQSGVIETAEEDGSFEAMVEADIGNTLVLQLKVDDALSYERYITIE